MAIEPEQYEGHELPETMASFVDRMGLDHSRVERLLRPGDVLCQAHVDGETWFCRDWRWITSIHDPLVPYDIIEYGTEEWTCVGDTFLVLYAHQRLKVSTLGTMVTNSRIHTIGVLTHEGTSGLVCIGFYLPDDLEQTHGWRFVMP